jgi:DNA polymerase III alpha subunit
MVYQEDVMKIVHHFAGLDLDESDVLRRIMTGKKKSGDTFRKLRDKYFRNCKKRGYPEQLSQEVWRQIESFSGYSFCKAHSASFAVESFQSLYLKTYYPLEFMVAVINNFGGFYSTELYVHEARMLGGKIHPPCVNKSRHLTHLYEKDIYLGFIHLKSLETKVAKAIVREREQNGPYRSLTEFIRRVKAGKEQIQILLRIGAFSFTGKDKCALMWELQQAFSPVTVPTRQPLLIEEPMEEFELPQLDAHRFDQSFDEIELLGFPLCSPFELLQETPRGILSKDMAHYCGKIVEMTGYYVTRKHVTTVHKQHMNFGTWLDEEGRFFDTTHFPKELKRSPFEGKGCYRIKGKIVSDFGFHTMDVIEMEKLPWVKDKRYE